MRVGFGSRKKREGQQRQMGEMDQVQQYQWSNSIMDTGIVIIIQVHGFKQQHRKCRAFLPLMNSGLLKKVREILILLAFLSFLGDSTSQTGLVLSMTLQDKDI